MYNVYGDYMQRIIMFRKLNDEDVSTIESLFENESFEYEISKYSKSLTLYGNNDVLAYAKRILLNNGFELL